MARKFGEDDLQMAVAKYLDLMPVVWCHVANERRTGVVAGRRLKNKGVKRGVPDVLIFTRRNGYCGMAVELKVKGGKTTAFQKEWLRYLEKENWYTAVCVGLDEFLMHFDKYYGKQ